MPGSREMVRSELGDVRFSNRPFGVKAFRLSTAHAFRQYHQNTPTIPSTPAATKTKINAEFSIQAIAGMPDAGHLYRWRSCPFLAQICLLGLIMAG
jgi:hypothetical protein